VRFYALDVPCPRCLAPTGTACASLVNRRRRLRVHPHLDRISAAREATLRSERRR
jgi:hypothetical protein